MDVPGAEFRTKPELVRPAFRRVIERWADVSATAERDGVVLLRRAARATPGDTALVIVGKNRLDPRLFERCAAHHIGRLLEDGWSVVLLDFDFTVEPPGAAPPPARPAPGVLVQRLLAETERLRYVLLLTHSRFAVNLTDSGNDLVVDPPASDAAPSSEVHIARLRLSESAAKDGSIDAFGCLCRPKARWPRELAKALGWPVRTVYPGYSIYFPAGQSHPKAAIPNTGAARRSRFSERGWALWLPGADRPVRVSGPGQAERRYDAAPYDLVERLLVTIISEGLEPLRDFLKLRRLAAQAKRQRETS